MPYRGKTNNPSYVPLVAQQIATIKGMPVEAVAQATSLNFEQLFLQANRLESGLSHP
jgi:TatD DNase family protein